MKGILLACIFTAVCWLAIGAVVVAMTGCGYQPNHSERLSGIDQLTEQDRAELQTLINEVAND